MMMTKVETSIAKYQTCIDACVKCSQACNQCFNSCLHEPDVGSRVNCIKLMRLCADLCDLAVRAMTIDDPTAKYICSVCGTICDACAAECTMFQDSHCQQCVQACQLCAEECVNMP
ncbi:MAG TPA: four-helix bundle copper-binding protein [Syntrophomonas sp.]|nr:four-helix bundle copper-binding protein [Syntrophomonas sp.]